MIEPQAQVIHQNVSLDSQNDGISQVSFDSDPAWTGRLGARLKGRYEVSGLPLEPYLRANLWHTFSGTDTVTFAGNTDIDTGQKSSYADLGIGARADAGALRQRVRQCRLLQQYRQSAPAGNDGKCRYQDQLVKLSKGSSS